MNKKSPRPYRPGAVINNKKSVFTDTVLLFQFYGTVRLQKRNKDTKYLFEKRMFG